MPSDYSKICEDNIRRRGEEFDDLGKLISEQIYTDRTHFVFELLQNAEDALGRRKQNNSDSKLSTAVKFILYEDKLEFRHFGEKFNTEDVLGISDVLKGTKSEDKTQIGKFGIGFKSVYAFTSTPEIHSGDEHFIIKRYIRPESTDLISQIVEGETVFVFPFNHEKLSTEQAFNEIRTKLEKIGSRVLLFLKNITEIEWEIYNQNNEGMYLKEIEQKDNLIQEITVIGEHGNEVQVDEKWLVFRQEVENSAQSSGAFVEIAFNLKDDPKKGKQIIERIEFSPLIVYFPTKFETHLGFFIHGPYDTNASRSDIENNIWNKELISETAGLLVNKVLPWLKENELLSTMFLEALPIKSEEFPEDSLLHPMYDQIWGALREQEFLPATNGEFVAGKHAVLARGEELVNLIDSVQLEQLLDVKEVKWLTTDITETKRDLHRYLVGWKPQLPSYWKQQLSSYSSLKEVKPLIIMELRPENLIDRLTSHFLEKQNIVWLLQFYSFCSKRDALIGRLKTKPIIRIDDGSHVIPFNQDDSPNAFLPPEISTKFPTVAREVCDDKKALMFLRTLGLKEPDIVDEVIDSILPKYTSDSLITIEEHLLDLQAIQKAYETDSRVKKDRLRKKLCETPFVLSESQNSKDLNYRYPSELYFVTPSLRAYFSGNPSVGFIHSDYSEATILLLKELGVSDQIKAKFRRCQQSKEFVTLQYDNNYRRGLNGFDPDIQIVGFEFAINNPTLKRSMVIWNRVAVKYSHYIKGEVLTCSRQDFSTNASVHRVENEQSKFGCLLIESAWIPDTKGNFCKPIDLTLDDLPSGFSIDERLSRQLNMKKNVIAELAKEAGISVEALNRARKIETLSSEIQEKFDQLLNADSSVKHSFPQKTSSNPDRRLEKLSQELGNSPEKKFEYRSRSVRTTANVVNPTLWLRNLYKNDDGQMICQICEEEMPFRKRNGEYYFEAIEVFSKEHFEKEHEAQYLALCPLCSAKYKEFIKSDEGAMLDLKKRLMCEEENLRYPLLFGQENGTLRFMEIHFNDVNAILINQK